jgi:hypothetical protein
LGRAPPDLVVLLDTDESTVRAWLDLTRDPTPPGWVERRLLSVHPAMGAKYRAEMDAAFEPRTPKATRVRLLARVNRAHAHLEVALADDLADDGEINRDHSAHLAELDGATVDALRYEADEARPTLPGLVSR